MPDRALPLFNSHAGNIKTVPLTLGPREPPDVVRRFVERCADRSSAGREGGTLRVLDVGCGRGDTVAWLCARGFDAFGVDVDESYLEQGRSYLDQTGYGGTRLRVIAAGRYPFDDGAFDVVLSNQVLEHVADLDRFCAEVSRVSNPGARGQHVFPARWRPVEVHMRTPLVHWLPKGAPRRLALGAALRVGAAAPYFTDLPLRERVQVFAEYSDANTYYRPVREISRTMAAFGLQTSVRRPARDRVQELVPALPDAVVPLAAWVYRTAFSVCLETRRR
jgi:SAM-dependent methyltransferase